MDGSGAWQLLRSHFDGNWVDIGSLLLGCLYAISRNARKPKQRFLSKETAADIANGTALFPLGVLGFSVFSTWLVGQLLHANRLILSVAGLAALFALLDEQIRDVDSGA